MTSVCICAGEASGDLNGSALATELSRILPGVELWGGGGPKMAAAGVDLVVSTTGGGSIGIAESLKSLPGVLAKYHILKRQLLSRRPDLFIPIDFGAFNVRLGRAASIAGIEVVYYFPPSSWRRRSRRSDALKACGGKVVTPFSWSAENLRAQGIDARFVGHPLVDIVKARRSREQFFADYGFSITDPLVGLLPGSRSHEIDSHLTPMLGAARTIHEQLSGAQFAIAAAHPSAKIARAVEEFKRGRPDLPVVRVVDAATYDCMAHSDLLLATSGTATLEAAILGTPMVIVYRGTGIMRFEYLFRHSILEDYIGMPNIVAGRLIVPELLGKDVCADNMASHALEILTDEEHAAQMRRDMADVRSALGEEGAVRRAAETIIEMAGRQIS